MQTKQIHANLHVTGQIKPADIANLKELGFRSIISNRPDGEGAGQPAFADIATAAENHGLEARHLPVLPVQGGITGQILHGFAEALAELPGPILAYCRSGARSEMLYALGVTHNLVDNRAL